MQTAQHLEHTCIRAHTCIKHTTWRQGTELVVGNVFTTPLYYSSYYGTWRQGNELVVGHVQIHQ
jgi:hypothetical protein